ncbi:unnamed protein product [Phaedon cochleariae]|uniref:Uncharacterized protein n=1 Tax=Phaedon cochleariae TaxID=80249 RepID=A0A9N9SFV2_PHACE|nr:unnamed protein product [Phaedon cochleariae]
MLLLLAAFSIPVYHTLEYEDIDVLTNYDVQFAQLAQANNSPAPKKKQGFSAGSGLRSIAEGSFNAANDAVNNQDAAGHQAAYVAKNTLAQSAAAASATAQAALAGKQILLQGLEQQHRDAQTALMGEQQQLMQRAAVEARQHVQVLTNTLNAAQAAADHVTQAASEAAGELAAQQAMVGSAMDRLQALGKQLAAVRIDFEATRAAAQKAQASAQAAAANAAAAAAAAAAGLAKNAGKQPLPPPPPPPPQPADGGKQGGNGAKGGSGGANSGSGGGKSSAGGSKYIADASYEENSFYHPLYYGEN